MLRHLKNIKYEAEWFNIYKNQENIEENKKEDFVKILAENWEEIRECSYKNANITFYTINEKGIQEIIEAPGIFNLQANYLDDYTTNDKKIILGSYNEIVHIFNIKKEK